MTRTHARAQAHTNRHFIHAHSYNESRRDSPSTLTLTHMHTRALLNQCHPHPYCYQVWLFGVPARPPASSSPFPFCHPPHFLPPSLSHCPPSLHPSLSLSLSLSPCQFSECHWKVLLSADISNHSPGRPNYGHTFNVWGQSRTWAEFKVEHKGNFSFARSPPLTLVVSLSLPHAYHRFTTLIYLSIYLSGCMMTDEL